MVNCIILFAKTHYSIDEPCQEFGHDHFMLQNSTFCGGGHDYFGYTFVAG
jgi:hypothetical protein